MPSLVFMPHIDLILQALRINRARLESKSKIAVDARLVRLLLQVAASQLPFSEEFYQSNYPDIKAAHETGIIPNLHRHFVETGYLEGRFGAPPPMDEAFYTAMYPDVADAVGAGDVVSGAEHYMRAGAAEGRIPNATIRAELERWLSVLRDDPARMSV